MKKQTARVTKRRATKKQPARVSNRRVTKRQIAAAARHIAETFDPEKIILFGSYAYGKPRPESDVDLLIIMDSGIPRWKLVGAIYSSFRPYPFSMDIHVATPHRIQERLSLGDPFFGEITKQGHVLYERTR